MNDKVYNKLKFLIIFLGIISVIILLVIAIVCFKDVSIIEYISKELW
ncbi:MAG: hypothetical protein WCR67_04955 [Bacilli bacterium]